MKKGAQFDGVVPGSTYLENLSVKSNSSGPKHHLTPTREQSAVEQELRAWTAAGEPRCLMYGPNFSGKSLLCNRIPSFLATETRAIALPIGVRWGMATQLEVARRLHEELWTSERTEPQDQHGLLAGIRSWLWTERDDDEPRLILIVDGIDNCRDLASLDEHINALPDFRILVSISGDETDARGWLDRIGWNVDEIKLLSVPELSTNLESLPGWLRRVKASPSLANYLTSWVNEQSDRIEVATLLGEALAPLRAPEVATILGLSAARAEEMLASLESEEGPIERDPVTNGWLFRHDSLAACFREQFPLLVQNIRTRIGMVSAGIVRSVVQGELERDAGNYLVRFGSAHGKLAGNAPVLAPYTEPEWCAPGASLPDHQAFADARYAREAAEIQLSKELETLGSTTGDSLRLQVRATLTQGALSWAISYARRRPPEDDTDSEPEITAEAARLWALIRLGAQLQGAPNVQVLELALSVALRRGARGVNDLLTGARLYVLPLPSWAMVYLADWIAQQGPSELEHLDVLASMELAEVAKEGAREQLLAQGDRSVREGFRKFHIHELLPHAARLPSLGVGDWANGVIAEQKKQYDFTGFVKMRIPKNWAGAEEFAKQLVRRASEIYDGTRRLLVLAHALEIPSSEEWRSTALSAARELWPEQAYYLTAAPWVTPLLVDGLDDSELLRFAHEGNADLKGALIDPLVQRGYVDLAVECALEQDILRRLPRLAKLAMALRDRYPEQAAVVAKRVHDRFDHPDESPCALLNDAPELVVQLVDLEQAISVASTMGTYYCIAALGHLIPNLPQALAVRATAQAIELYADEADPSALDSLLHCAPWMSPSDALWLFTYNLLYDWQRIGLLPDAFEGITSLGQLAPLIPLFAGSEGVVAVAQEISKCPWLDRKPLP